MAGGLLSAWVNTTSTDKSCVFNRNSMGIADTVRARHMSITGERVAMRKLLFLAFFFVVCSIAWGQPNADFGDLGDPTFPTRRVSTSAVSGRTGPFHIDTTHEWIGVLPTSSTTLEPDAKPVDEDDGIIRLENVYFQGRFMRTGRVSVPVTTDGDSAIRYLNVAADLNGDGVFQTYPAGPRLQYEWLVVNLPIAFKNETKVVTTIFTLNAPVPMAGAVRATLTTEQIPKAPFGTNGWDGSGPLGGFARGETEDLVGIPIVVNNYDPGGVDEVPPLVPRPPYTPENRPIPGAPVRVGPKEAPPVIQPPNAPLRPGEGVAPYVPETDAPLRADEADSNGVVDSASNAGMPDIKQGPMECVPAATANSLSYLANKAGQRPADSDAFNRDLFNKLKAAMNTSSTNGTHVSSDQPESNDFLNGKVRAQTGGAIQNGKITTCQMNPSLDNICDAVKAGKDVEIVITCRDKNGNKVAQHMVTVVGYVKKADGTVELKIHDPNDLSGGEGSGDSAKPPREHTLIVKPSPSGSNKGGLEVQGMVRDEASESSNDDGHTYGIDQLYVEHLAQENVPVTAVNTGGQVEAGGKLTLTASTGGKADGFEYQWMKDGMDIPDATNAVYEIDPVSELDSGVYTCWAYDDASETYGVSSGVDVTILPEGSLSTVTVWGFALLMAVLLTAFRVCSRRMTC